jgi:regulator of sigma E protease
VKIAGMIDESMDKEQMAQPPKPWEFRSKPAWQRLIIMLGGVTMNIIVAIVIFVAMFFAWGDYRVKEMPDGYAVHEMFEEMGFQDGDQILMVNGENFDKPFPAIDQQLLARDIQNITVLHQNGETETLPVPEEIGDQMFREGVMFPFRYNTKPIIDSVMTGMPGAKAGLQKGDRIVSINEKEVVTWADLDDLMNQNKDEKVRVQIERDGKTLALSITPTEKGILGVFSTPPSVELEKTHYGFLESIGKGIERGYWQTHDYIAQLGYIFTPKGAQSLGGFGTIGSLYPETWNWQGFWEITAIISIILAVMNLLPIPALDGGHVMFLLYEMITNRKPNEKILEYAQVAGFFLLIALFLYANGNDIYRFLIK